MTTTTQMERWAADAAGDGMTITGYILEDGTLLCTGCVGAVGIADVCGYMGCHPKNAMYAEAATCERCGKTIAWM